MDNSGDGTNQPGPPADGNFPEVAVNLEPVPSRKRDPRSRAALLARLPCLEFTSWSARTHFGADEDWAAGVSLGSDSLLAPLEPLSPGKRG